MLVVAKTPRIKVRITGPGARRVASLVTRSIRGAAIVNDDEDEFVDITQTDWYKSMSAKMTSGKVLRHYRENAGLSMTELAEKSGIALAHISAMEHDKRAIGKISAQRLGKALSCDYKRFL